MADPRTQKENENIDDAEYEARTITVLKGLDAVRKRPGMFIGDTDDGSGLHQTIQNVMENAAEDPLCDLIVVTLNADRSATVEYTGIGLCSRVSCDEGAPAKEVFRQLFGSLRGVGVEVVNFLSSWLALTFWRDGKEYGLRFENGAALNLLTRTGDASKCGVKISFLPSPEIFSMRDFDFAEVERRSRRFAFREWGRTVVLTDARSNPPRRASLRLPILMNGKKALPHG